MKAAKSRQIVPNDAGTAAAWEEVGVAITELTALMAAAITRCPFVEINTSRFGRYVRRRGVSEN